MARRAALLGLSLALCACAEPSSTPPRPDRRADKEAAYGDPTLLPTREGERVRMEVALAREIEQAIVLLPEVTRARVDVEQPRRHHDGPTRVLAVVETTTSADSLRSTIDAIARTIAGPDATIELVLASSPSEPSPPPSWPLLLGILGLGLSLGISIERGRALYGSWSRRLR